VYKYIGKLLVIYTYVYSVYISYVADAVREEVLVIYTYVCTLTGHPYIRVQCTYILESY